MVLDFLLIILKFRRYWNKVFIVLRGKYLEFGIFLFSLVILSMRIKYLFNIGKDLNYIFFIYLFRKIILVVILLKEG